MFRNNDKISPSQIANILILIMLGTGVLTLPRSLAEAAGADGWIILLVGGLLISLIAIAQAYIVKSLPGKNYMEIITATLSKPVAYIYIVFLVLFLIMLNGFLVRIFAEVVKMFLLFRTPLEVIIVSVLLVTVYLVRQGIEPLARMADLLLPTISILSLVLFALTIRSGDLKNLLPVFQVSLKQIVEAIPLVLFSFLGFEFVLIFGTYVNKPEKLTKSSGGAVLFILLIYSVLNLATMLTFGTEQTVHLIWPTLTLFKTIEFPGLFIENVEAFVMALWVFIVFMSIAPLYLAKVVLLSDLIKTKEFNFFALPLIPLVYLASLIGDSLAEAYEILDIFTKYAATIVAFIFPALILISLLIRKKLKKEGNTNA
ncbi:GerAB/ArcD/ProY family transporter [Alkaliphilus peptidifermentans]|uniref:Spore germination protein n=1 Tax=Alkaliphilus peptidifermentans DSM 18978 TaxID=1120976 RepID=A0A1G5KJ03_9FIRM|nr:endospore germination permease [Alkaliphilus peptidifermentans]SCZ00080.1 spore germination protein [Alkaliphilus peptidifermentans DSM 18978]